MAIRDNNQSKPPLHPKRSSQKNNNKAQKNVFDAKSLNFDNNHQEESESLKLVKDIIKNQDDQDEIMRILKEKRAARAEGSFQPEPDPLNLIRNANDQREILNNLRNIRSSRIKELLEKDSFRSEFKEKPLDNSRPPKSPSR